MGVLHRGEAVPETLETLVPYIVRQSIGMLDLYGPDGWRDRIDLDNLDMPSQSWCVLAQAYEPDYRQAREAYKAAYILRAAWDGEGERPKMPQDPHGSPYYYGRDKLWHASGHAAEGVLTSEELMYASGFMDCYAHQAAETHLDAYISMATLQHVWLAELSK